MKLLLLLLTTTISSFASAAAFGYTNRGSGASIFSIFAFIMVMFVIVYMYGVIRVAIDKLKRNTEPTEQDIIDADKAYFAAISEESKKRLDANIEKYRKELEEV